MKQFDGCYSKEKAEKMRNILMSVTKDIQFDIDRGNIDAVFNGIEYNRNTNLKDKATFCRMYGEHGLSESEIAEIIGTAIGIAYSFCFVDD